MSDGLPCKRLIGYADRMSVRPGDRLRFMVSCEDVSDYQAEIVRLVSGDLHPQGLGLIEHPVATSVTGTYPGHHQPLHAGSYAIIEKPDDFDGLRDLTLQAMIWPTSPGGHRQVILSRWSNTERRGWALTLDETGALALDVGDGAATTRITTGIPLLAREWVFVAASFESASGRVRLYQESQVSIGRAAAPILREEALSFAPGAATGLPLMIAACAAGTDPIVAADHFNGKIDSPRIAGRALDRAGMEALLRPSAALPPWVLAAWDFSQDMGSDGIVDLSAFRRHGRLVNLPARAMKGFNWTGEVYDWTVAAGQYGAIHFHDDDLYDAGWDADFELVIPDSMRSGVYAAKLTTGGEAEYIPFAVRPGRGATTADAVVLLPTASYMAYANERAGLDGGGRLHAFANHLIALSAGDLWLNDHPEVGGSLYDRHSDGSGVCYSSRLRPILNFRPGITNAWIGAAGTAPWQFNADLALISWLEARGIPYDVTTDEDLHEDGLAALAPYRAVMTGSHPEYYSREMYDALTAFLAQGGRLMYLGGNGFYWRIAYRSLPGVIELRRAEDGIRDWVAEGGEYYHSFTGEYGGMWSRMGRPIHALAGIGMAAQGFDVSSYYRRREGSHDPRAAFIFDGVAEEMIGDFGTVGGGAAGLELDRCDVSQGSPPHTLVLASSENHSDTYFPPPDEINNATAMMDGRQNPNIRADMVFFETPSGGAVFSTGSISWIGSLTYDGCTNNVSRITENVLRRFIDPAPFRYPAG